MNTIVVLVFLFFGTISNDIGLPFNLPNVLSAPGPVLSAPGQDRSAPGPDRSAPALRSGVASSLYYDGGNGLQFFGQEGKTEADAYLMGYIDCSGMMLESSRSVNDLKKALEKRKTNPFGPKQPKLLNKWETAFRDCLIEYMKSFNILTPHYLQEFHRTVVLKPSNSRLTHPEMRESALKAYEQGYQDGFDVIKECTLSLAKFKKVFSEIVSNPFRRYGSDSGYNALEYISGFQEAWERFQFAFELKSSFVMGPRKDRTNPGSAAEYIDRGIANYIKGRT